MLGRQLWAKRALPCLPACLQTHDALFATELKKYDVLVADIKRNTEAQAELLTRISTQNRVSVLIGLLQVACKMTRCCRSHVTYVHASKHLFCARFVQEVSTLKARQAGFVCKHFWEQHLACISLPDMGFRIRGWVVGCGWAAPPFALSLPVTAN